MSGDVMMKVWYVINRGSCLVRVDYFVRTEEGTYQTFVNYRKRLNKKRWRHKYIFSYRAQKRNYSLNYNPEGLYSYFYISQLRV